jgi:hypothetical protein
MLQQTMQIKKQELLGSNLLRVSDMTEAIQAIDFDNAWDNTEKRELYKSWLPEIVKELAIFVKSMDREGELRKYAERQGDVVVIADTLKKYIDNERHEHEIDYLRYESKDHEKKLYKQIGTFMGLIVSGILGAVIQEISAENGAKVGNILKRFTNKFSEIFSEYPVEMSGSIFIVLLGIYTNWKLKEYNLNRKLNRYIKPGNDEFVWDMLANMHQVDEDVRRRFVVLGRMFRRIVEYRQKDAVVKLKTEKEAGLNTNTTNADAVRNEMDVIMQEISKILS